MTDELIATIPKNTREEIRIGFDEWNGHPLVNLRVWVDDDTPTKKGLSFNPRLLPEVIAALETARLMWEAEQ